MVQWPGTGSMCSNMIQKCSHWSRTGTETTIHYFLLYQFRSLYHPQYRAVWINHNDHVYRFYGDGVGEQRVMIIDNQKSKVTFTYNLKVVANVTHSDITWGIPLQTHEKKNWKETQSVKWPSHFVLVARSNWLQLNDTDTLITRKLG